MPQIDHRYDDEPFFAWNARDIVALVVRGPAANAATVLGSLQHERDDCCWSSLLKMTATEVVFSRGAEKLERLQNVKFYFDERTGQVTRGDYSPFSFLRLIEAAGATEIALENHQDLVRVRPTAVAPFLEIVGAPRPVTDADRPAHVDEYSGTEIPGFTLPQSRPPVTITVQRRGRSGEPHTYTQVAEIIGPTTREGSKVWFGKRFAGDPTNAIGGFGYFDSLTGKSELFSSPELRQYSVSRIFVEPDAIWLARVTQGDMGDSPYGLVRVRRPQMQMDVVPFSRNVQALVRLGDRLYIPTEEGVSILFPGGAVEHWFVDVNRTGRYELSKELTGPVRSVR
jgi:hypothetical protein